MAWKDVICICSVSCIAAIIAVVFKVRVKESAESIQNSKESDLPCEIFDKTKISTSVWCSGVSNVDRLCRFQNLCFSPQLEEFIFVHSGKSLLDGIPKNRFNPALVDLSSVRDHNTQYFHYTDAHQELLSDFQDIEFRHGNYLFFNRFNPENIMHVFHDDLMPLFFTLLHHNMINLQNLTSSATLTALEGWHHGEYSRLYDSLSQSNLLVWSNLVNSKSDLICFEEAYVGLSQVSLWYQYGFNVPQGPIPNDSLSAREIRLFKSYFQSKLNISSEPKTRNEWTIILLSRNSNRLILNEDELTANLAQKFDCKVVVMSLESHSLEEIIREISSAFGLIGVHGSLLILSMFLPFGSMLIEIFPYGIDPDHYVPYKTLVTKSGMGITYKSWRNVKPENTVIYPDGPPKLGGISHLPRERQEEILRSREVPLHLCCNDPEWLFRIYQDTIVDIPSFFTTVEEAVEELHELSNKGPTKRAILKEIETHKMYPSRVRDITCQVHKRECSGPNCGSSFSKNVVQVTWNEPWNLSHLDVKKVQYEIWVQESNSAVAKAYIIESLEFVLPETENNKDYIVWVRCIADSKTGLMTSTPCTEHETV